MQKYSNDIFTTLGGTIVPLASASCYVYNYGTTTLATIYSDNGVTSQTNPITTTATGNVSFYAADGRYSLSIQKTGYTTVSLTDVLLEDTQDSLTYSDTGIIASFSSTTAGYNQLVLQNKSAASNASANFNISNDAATSTTNFLEMGMNSSGFTGTGSFSQASFAYLASASTDLVIGTYAAKGIHFVIGGAATDAATIDASSNFINNVNTSAPTLTVNGQMVFSLTSNTNLRISVRGTDGTTRTANITLS